MSEVATPYFECKGVRKSFGDSLVLDDVNLSVPQGKTTVILGGSGAGKSVLLKHLNGLLQPDRGEIFVKGDSTKSFGENDWKPFRRRMGILFQNGALFDSMTLAENVAFPLVEGGVDSKSEINEKVEEALRLVELENHREAMPDSLSGGMRKRAAFARAIVARPDVMLYDEPTAGLDPVLAEAVGELIFSLRNSFSLTSVVVTHHLGLMRSVGDQVVFLDSGKVLFSGTPREFEASTNEVIIRFREADEMGTRVGEGRGN